MRIVMFTNTYKPHVGGVARSVDFFAEDLRREGHRVLVVAPEFPGAEDADPETLLRVPAIQEFNGSDFSVRLPAPFRIEPLLEAFAPEIIHSHHPFLMGDTAVRVARGRNLPLVFTHHTLYEQYTHYVPLDSEAMQRFVIHLATDYANFSTRVVAPSRSIAGLIRSRGVRSPVDVVPTGVDLAFFGSGQGQRFRRKHRIPEDAVVAGHLGRLAPEKNLTYLAHALVQVVAERPAARFLVVGAGPSSEAIQACFDDQGFANRLIMAGELSGQALVDAYDAMDLFVFASQSETQGMVLAEAMAAGKPVIALDASGVREVVSDMRRDDQVDLAEALRVLVQDVPAPVIHLDLPADHVRVDADRAQVLLRSAQEIVTNTVRHARAENLWIRLSSAQDGLALSARDDGQGVSQVRSGNGLTGMAERLVALGGKLEVESARGAGFTLHLWMPLEG